MLVDLNSFNNSTFSRGKPKWVEVLWQLTQVFIVSTGIPGSGFRVRLLRMFGAKIGHNVVIKSGLKVKFPWRLQIGDNSWIGEDVWIDNLAEVSIGDNCCISQGVYFCTGNHNWAKKSFDLVLGKIVVEDAAWLCAMSRVGPNVRIKQGAILTLGSSVVTNMEAYSVYTGVPATYIKERKIAA